MPNKRVEDDGRNISGFRWISLPRMVFQPAAHPWRWVARDTGRIVAHEVCCPKSEEPIEGGPKAQCPGRRSAVSYAALPATRLLRIDRLGWHGPSVCRSAPVLHHILCPRVQARGGGRRIQASKVPGTCNRGRGGIHRPRRRASSRKKGLRISETDTASRAHTQ
jgi:hypothetical protein